MIRVIIIDDERPAVEELSFILGQHESVEIIGIFTESSKALDYIKKNKPDVIFLDIEMPGNNGIELAKKIYDISANIKVIFVTAYDDYAIKAFEINAVDYILKPYEEKRIYDALNRLKTTNNSSIKKKNPPCSLNKIAVWDGDRIALIPINSIILLTLENGNVLIETNSKTYYSNDTLNVLENKLINYNFFRCHRSYIVNLDKIQEIIPWFNNTYMLKMTDSKNNVPVSRRNAKTLKELLNI